MVIAYKSEHLKGLQTIQIYLTLFCFLTGLGLVWQRWMDIWMPEHLSRRCERWWNGSKNTQKDKFSWRYAVVERQNIVSLIVFLLTTAVNYSPGLCCKDELRCSADNSTREGRWNYKKNYKMMEHRQNSNTLNWFWRGTRQHWHGEILRTSGALLLFLLLQPPSLWTCSSPPHLYPHLPFYPTLPRVHSVLSVSSASHLILSTSSVGSFWLCDQFYAHLLLHYNKSLAGHAFSHFHQPRHWAWTHNHISNMHSCTDSESISLCVLKAAFTDWWT